METDNQKRARLLGEPFGTATSRLRKMLMFDMAKRLDEDKCYRCGVKIETLEEFSIEHTVSWQGNENPRETFFDLSKISYSHLSCNSSAGGNTRYKNDNAPNGTRWCNRGKHYQPLEIFHKDTSNKEGLSHTCNPCHIDRVDKYRREVGKRPEIRKFSKGSKYT